MPAPISILEATEPDVPTMVAIFCDAMEEDILTLFLNGHRRVDAVRRQTETLTTVLGRRFTHPTNRCHIIKAVDTQTGELVGWSLLRWEDGIKPDAPTESGLEQRDFRVFYGGEQKKKMFGLTEGKEHIVLGGLYVRPERHGQGIGRELVEDFYSKYDLDKELVFVQTRATSEGFWEKMGWTTVDSLDIDLSEWGGKGRGYGVHRSPQMLRHPKS